MLLAGIQAESGLDPRLKHSGVTIWELAPLQPTPLSKEVAKYTKLGKEIHFPYRKHAKAQSERFGNPILTSLRLCAS